MQPGEKVHKTPIKVSGAAAADEDELCAWLSDKACLDQRVINKSMGKLHEEDVYDLDALQALRRLDGLGDVFSRVAASQVADALDALGKLSIGEHKQEPLPTELTTPSPQPRAPRVSHAPNMCTRNTCYSEKRITRKRNPPFFRRVPPLCKKRVPCEEVAQLQF